MINRDELSGTNQVEVETSTASFSSPSPVPYCRFSIKSHNICYGSLHNIWHAVNSPPLTTWPAVVQPLLSGTVKMHQYDHNLPAKNGSWSVYQLVNLKSEGREICGWFTCHENVDPENEISKILRVSGSPYEIDGGSSLNNEETVEAGILVINRYDWGYHDHRSRELFPDANELFLTVGIVDRFHARDEITRWKDQPAKERSSSESGVWMYIPGSEYLFGRFAFDESKSRAQSVLFFTGSTCFTETAFSGLNNALRKFETHEERFARRLREGYDFSGIRRLKEMTRPPPFAVSQPLFYEVPPREQWLGPYDKVDHIWSQSDIDGLRMYTHVIGIAETEMAHLSDLTNEVMMQYLEHSVLPHCSCGTLGQAAAALFPKYSTSLGNINLDTYLHRYFTHATSDPPVACGYNTDAVNRRIRRFLTTRYQIDSHDDMALDDECIAGLHRVLVYLVSELMELGQNIARDSYRDRIVPYDFRLSIFNDHELRTMFQYSKVFWEGG